ncbi:class I SAM-dependent methyltransferase [Leptolyngbya sp. O-77]|uniref:class I SAM-dependent methyltransferase n=1 Tax=Leptolyngbya sp. O-77 TaxID=1080068 RepID=UPI00074D2C07|nr:class I SAM-dependent methyltransferase [Leptolyngbya sp. O-77]BAU40254.1 Leucine carboxyl methyltransferase [Leptolyngbya sp. O-77]
MQLREPTDQLTGVAETLMITLYARAIETQRPEPILSDRKAVEIAESLDYDFSKYENGWASQLGCVIRARAIDRIVQNFLETHPSAVIVNLGAGLCTRFSRIDNGQVRWYEVDFPEVIALRHKFFQESNRHHFIAKSMLDFTWMDAIQREPNQPMMIVYEGVSMYLSEAENKALLQQINARFSPVEILFDVLNRKRSRTTKHHDTVSKTNAEFKWGIDQSSKLETWGSNIWLKHEEFYLSQFLNYSQRLPIAWSILAQLLPFIPLALFKNSGRIVQLQIGNYSE